MVRKELLVFFSTFVKRYQNKFLVSAYETWAEERDNLMHAGIDGQKSRSAVNGQQHDDSEDTRTSRISQNTVQGSIWLHLLVMSVDAHPEVAQAASVIVDYVHEALLESPLATQAQQIIDNILELTRQSTSSSRQPSATPSSRSLHPPTSTAPQGQPKNEGYLSVGIRRNASVAAALKYLGLGGSNSSEISPSTPDAVQQSAQQKRLSGPVRQGIPAEWSTPPNQNDHAPTTVKYQKARSPLPKGYKKRDPHEPPTLPLQSVFFEWSIEVPSHSPLSNLTNCAN